MKRAVMWGVIGLVLVSQVNFWAGYTTGRDNARAEAPAVVPTGHVYVPKCAEDVVVVGMGEFDNGRWSAYKCGPARDSLDAGMMFEQAFPEWVESASGTSTMARWLCEPFHQRAWYFTVEATACRNV